MTKKQALKFSERQGDSLASCFGYTKGQFIDLHDALAKYTLDSIMGTMIKIQDLESIEEKRNYIKELSEGDTLSKVTNLKKFLESEDFSKLNFELESPNSYFVLGYIFNTICMAMDQATLETLKVMRDKNKNNSVKDLVNKLLSDD